MTEANSPSDQEVYRCWFDDPQGGRRFVDVPRQRGIAAFQEGVWVDAEWNYTVGSDCLNWIPPSRFVIVTKLETADG